MAPHAMPAALSRGKASFMTRLTDGLEGTSQNQLQKPSVAEQNPADRETDP